VNASRARCGSSAAPGRVGLMERSKVELPHRRCGIDRKLPNHVPQTRSLETQQQGAWLTLDRLRRRHDGVSMSAQSDASDSGRTDNEELAMGELQAPRRMHSSLTRRAGALALSRRRDGEPDHTTRDRVVAIAIGGPPQARLESDGWSQRNRSASWRCCVAWKGSCARRRRALAGLPVCGDLQALARLPLQRHRGHRGGRSAESCFRRHASYPRTVALMRPLARNVASIPAGVSRRAVL
jgi:hypothetical protein